MGQSMLTHAEQSVDIRLSRVVLCSRLRGEFGTLLPQATSGRPPPKSNRDHDFGPDFELVRRYENEQDPDPLLRIWSRFGHVLVTFRFFGDRDII